MKRRMASMGFLLVFGTWTMGQLMAAPPEPQSETLTVTKEGARYEHRIERSRFNVGAGVRHEAEGPYKRIVGDKGAFMVDTVTGATLAVPHAPAVPKGTPGGSDSPRALTENPDVHSALVQAYLVAAGIPAAEVSGTHVTTTMAGGGPVSGGIQPSQSKLLWYATHLERSLAGIPVEGSFAFAALDSAGDVITEGVYWPAIPASVVRQAQALKHRLDAVDEWHAFLARVKAVRPEVGEAVGEVKIVHTSARHHGTFEAKAVYSIVGRSATGGKRRSCGSMTQGLPWRWPTR
jgi:hypothetical protein